LLWQSARSQPSDFNFSTPLDSLLFSLMGIAIFILSMMMAFVTVLYFIHKIALNWLLSEAIDDKPSRLREIRICR